MEYSKKVKSAVKAISNLCAKSKYHHSLDTQAGILNIFVAGHISLIVEFNSDNLIIEGHVKHDSLPFAKSLFKKVGARLTKDYISLEDTNLDTFAIYAVYYDEN